jgi:hypothetical protein
MRRGRLPQDGELYVLAQSEDRVWKEQCAGANSSGYGGGSPSNRLRKSPPPPRPHSPPRSADLCISTLEISRA